MAHLDHAQCARPAARTYAPRFSLATTLAVWRQRRALAHMDDTRLADLGLTRQAARAEARRPFWDLPADRSAPRRT